MRFTKLKTQVSQGHGKSTAEQQQQQQKQQQQQSYFQRVCSQLASLRVSYQSKTSNKDDKSVHGEEEDTAAATSCKQDELRPADADQDLVYHLGDSDSEYYAIFQYQQHDQPAPNAPVDQDAGNSSSKKQTLRYYLPTWGEAKSCIQHTTTMIRDVCATKSSALLSSAWGVYPRNKEVSTPPFSPSSSSSGADTPPPKRRLKEKEQYEQWLMTTAGRESEISICMSYYSSRSLSGSSSRSSSFRDSTGRASENDPFRRRCSSTDSYKTICNARLSSDSGGARQGKRGEGDEDEDFGDEIIRDSLFMLNGKPYTVKNEWI